MAAGGNEGARAAIRSWIEQQRQEVDRQSYYQLLGVARDAPVVEIRDAYYRLVARLHPDLYGDLLEPETRDRLVTVYSRIVEAYRCLMEGARREAYDRGLAAGKLRWSADDERASKEGPEGGIRTRSAKRFFKLARSALAAGDARSAVMNLKLALSVEPDCEVLKAELARAEALGRPQGASAMEGGRTIRIRCASWDQVEAFARDKVKGTALQMRVPFVAGIGDEVDVSLGLPNGLVFSLAGHVTRIGTTDGSGRTAVLVELPGFTSVVRGRLERLVAEGRQEAEGPVAVDAPPAPPDVDPDPGSGDLLEPVPPPRLEDCDPEERPIFEALDEERRRTLAGAAHEVLGVEADADLAAIRRAWFALAKRHHPDVHARHRSPAIRQLAQEVFLRINRAYDRLRDAAIAAGARAPAGPARHGAGGWLVELGDLGDEDDELAPVVTMQAEPPGEPVVRSVVADLLSRPFDPEPVPAAAPGAPAEEAGRAALADGRWEEARERLAEALRADPRNRPLRALYHVASGMELRARGRPAEAMLQFETALMHDRDCAPARRALGQAGGDEPRGLLRRFFGR